MKKSICFVWFLCTLMLLWGCQSTEYKFQFHQPENQIDRIVMVDATGVNPIDLMVIDETERVAGLLIDIQQVKISKYFNDPSTSYGYLYIKVIYKDGAVDIIGTQNLEYKSANGTIENVYDGWYYADMDSMLALYEKYTGTALTIP